MSAWSQAHSIWVATLDRDVDHFDAPIFVATGEAVTTTVAACGHAVVVAWIEQTDAGKTLQLTAITSNAVGSTIAVDTGEIIDARLATSPGGAALAWCTSSETKVLRLDTNAQPTSAPVRADRSVARKSWVEIAARGGVYVVSWIESDPNPAYPCPMNTCPEDLQIRAMAALVDASSVSEPIALKSGAPNTTIPGANAPYPRCFAWSSTAGLVLWDQNETSEVVPIRGEFVAGVPLVRPGGFMNAAYDGRNFIVNQPGIPASTLLIVREDGAAGDVFLADAPYDQIVSGQNGQALLIQSPLNPSDKPRVARIFDDGENAPKHRATRH